MHRPSLRVAIPLAVVVALAAAAGTFVLTHQDHATALRPGAAVDKFRSSSTLIPTTATGTPRTAADLGVYSYTTTGYEKTDVLSGARHDYPAVSTITYTPTGCGEEDRWQPLVSRFGANVTCRTPAGLELRSTQQHREFFGRVQAQSFTCPAGFVELPTPAVVGHQSKATCPGSTGSIALTSKVLGSSVFQVGGGSVEVTHVMLAGTLTGQVTGTITRDLYFEADTGLLVRVTGTADTHSNTLAGPAKYTERYSLSLTSLTPQR